MSDTVLIIGGSGFIGANLSKQLLERGDAVINYDMRPPAPQLEWLLGRHKDEIAFEQGGLESWPQLLNAIKRHKPNKIAHLAAPIDLLGLNRNPKIAFDVMVAGTINVLEACKLFDIQRLVFFSSIGVLPEVQYQPIDANHPTLMANQGAGSGAYGAAKIAGEAFCWAYRTSNGLDFVILRPSAAYGFYTTNPTIFINRMVEAAVRGEPLAFESGREFPRDYTHVHDVAGIAAAALNAPSERLAHRVFYAATGQKLVTAGEVADIICEFVPGARITMASGLSELDQLSIKFRGTHDMAPVKDQLGYDVKYTDIREGIREYIETSARYFASTGGTPAKRS